MRLFSCHIRLSAFILLFLKRFAPGIRGCSLVFMEHFIKAIGIADARASYGVFNAANSRSDFTSGFQITKARNIVLKAHMHLAAEKVAKP